MGNGEVDHRQPRLHEDSCQKVCVYVCGPVEINTYSCRTSFPFFPLDLFASKADCIVNKWLQLSRGRDGSLRIQSLVEFLSSSGHRPDYLAGDCQLVADSGRRSLRSAERRVCSVPCQNSTFDDQSFAAAGPRAWNELPFSLRDTGLSLTTFNAHLKTYLFSTVFEATAHL